MEEKNFFICEKCFAGCETGIDEKIREQLGFISVEHPHGGSHGCGGKVKILPFSEALDCHRPRSTN